MTRILGNRVLIKPIAPPTHQGSVFIPERFRHHDPKTLSQYRVLAVGPGRKLKDGTLAPIPLKPGDFVLASLYLDHHVLEDGSRIVAFDQLEASWNYEQSQPA